MTDSPPRWRRRKTARPAEITAAALAVFADRGFAAARLDDIAARAGLSKAALYRYFETKTDLFRAVVTERAAPNLDAMAELAARPGLPFAELAPAVLARLAVVLGAPEVRKVAKMVIGESGNFPELAEVWHEAVVSRAVGLLMGLIARGQASGEVRPGEPRLLAMSWVGPMLMGALWREVIEPAGGAPIDLDGLAAEHAHTVLDGLRAKPEGPSS